MPTDVKSLLSAIGIVLLIAFIIYRRVRRSVGRQPYKPFRLGLRSALFSVLCIALLVLHPTTESFLADAIGAAVGISLGYYALRHTQFEITDKGNFYTPNLYISLSVVGLLLGRVFYRFVSTGIVPAANASTGAIPNPFAQMAASPLTTGIFFIMAAYYVYYNLGIISRMRAERA